ncbi:Acetylornithine deacetylase/Succinyl-diaminopimelate desuccinylase [Fodinibius salinus]|uniref:Acetylornithine deacetylase/Succinyl-diaminopimelate desuccinylase n=1 Tax=Fodinibius salinus TaxID=860790 RepID=A0A5D3YI27_9BACT|nr:dipeptidase [Fodinibius salinus]TYP93433.1 Acetylornithine deacetylase/Succinyl-diaminopimelate desuccinylase [Fodinibius salinus]
MSNVSDYIDSNKERFKAELFDFLRIPSISTDSDYKNDVKDAANYILDKLSSLDLDRTELFETDGNPIAYGELITDESKPTVLVYGHYDVQPPDPMDLWETPPFEPTMREGDIYARGASDDKGQSFTHVKALESYLRSDTDFPVNIKFIFEGEEEIGSPHLVPFIEEHKDLLECDMVLISDTAMFAEDTPSITYGLRGLAYMEVEIQGPNRDLHSGVYGGAVDNPANVLSDIISQLKDEDGVIQIDGFYDDVIELSEDDRETYRQLPFDEEEYKEKLGLAALKGEKGYNTLERTSARPTLDVNGMWSGYQGEGAKTVLPAKAGAKVSMRLVPDQDPKKIAKLFKKHVESLAPDTVSVEVTEHHGGHPAITDLSFYGLQAAADAFEEVYGIEPLFTREGGSIPIVADFQKVLGAQSILMGFGLNSDAIHSPNEKFALKDFYRGIRTSAKFFELLPEHS